MKELLQQIISKYNDKETLIIGIDGLGGAGKSTLANLLKTELENNKYNPVIFHIDDFIHPCHVRYDYEKEEWYCYYKIQWRYDYLIKEVLEPVKNGIEIEKQVEFYDKDNDMYFLEQIIVPRGSVILLEGIFLQRYEIREYLNYVVYLDVPKAIRLNRVINRDMYIGDEEEIKFKYERRYFPAEDKYIEEYNPVKNADFVLRNDGKETRTFLKVER